MNDQCLVQHEKYHLFITRNKKVVSPSINSLAQLFSYFSKATMFIPLEGFPRPWKFGSSHTIASGPQESLPPNMFHTPLGLCNYHILGLANLTIRKHTYKQTRETWSSISYASKVENLQTIPASEHICDSIQRLPGSVAMEGHDIIIHI